MSHVNATRPDKWWQDQFYAEIEVYEPMRKMLKRGETHQEIAQVLGISSKAVDRFATKENL